MKPRARTAPLVAAIALLLAACGAGRRGEPLVGPMDLSDPAVASGRTVYARQCNHCHPGGEAGLGPSLNDKLLPRWLMRFQVRHGLGAMPAFPEEQVSDGKVDDLLTYVKALRATEVPDTLK
jgi:mono/diheme cytochrome c family protein